MAGFKQPVYEILPSAYNLFGMIPAMNFWNKVQQPLADDAPRDYNYKLLDTSEWHMIYFKIKKKSRASGLEGVLYIDKNNFAVSLCE
jgi:hypothetical protein